MGTDRDKDLSRIGSEVAPGSASISEIRAKQEIEQFGRDSDRLEETKHVIHKCVKALVILIAVAFGTLFIVRVVLLMLPPSLTWLSEGQIGDIDHILLSGAGGGFLTSYIKRAVGGKDTPSESD